MNPTKYTLTVIAGILCSFGATHVLANGINPPRPVGSIIVKAVCTTRTDSGKKTFFRARIDDGAPGDFLQIKLSDDSESLRIADIKSISFVSSQVSDSGYLDAKLIRRGAANEEPASVQVQAKNNSPIALTGFSSTGSAVSIALSDCTAIDISPSSDSNETPRPAPKY